MPTKKAPMAPNYRVIWITDSIRGSFRRHRDESRLTNERAISKLVDTRLPKLVASLQKLGLTKQGSKHRPLRLPIDDASLDALNKASHATNMPLTTLLRLVIS
jgi:hypothetical protein